MVIISKDRLRKKGWVKHVPFVAEKANDKPHGKRPLLRSWNRWHLKKQSSAGSEYDSAAAAAAIKLKVPEKLAFLSS